MGNIEEENRMHNRRLEIIQNMKRQNELEKKQIYSKKYQKMKLKNIKRKMKDKNNQINIIMNKK